MAQRSPADRTTAPPRVPYPAGAVRLRLLDERERAAVALRDFKSANEMLAERLRLKAEALVEIGAEPVTGGAR